MAKAASATIIGIALCIIMATPASATIARTWVSGKGADGAGCGPVSTPCRTLQQAHDNTNPGDEINFLDSAGYGALTISKPINIINDGATAGVLAIANGNAITINAGSGDVVLRGLTVEGAGVGANGIVFNSGGSLHIGNCFVQGFVGADASHGNGILLQHSFAYVMISNATVINNGWTGVLYKPASGNGLDLTIDRLVSSKNKYGLTLDILAAGTSADASISNSIVSGNSEIGYNFVAGDYYYLLISLTNSAANQGKYGLSMSSNRVRVQLNNNVLHNNGYYDIDGGGSIYTYKNNVIQNVNSSVVKVVATPY